MNKNQFAVLIVGLFLILMVFISMEVTLIPYKFSLGQMEVTYGSMVSQMILTEEVDENGEVIHKEEVNEEELKEHEKDVENMRKAMTDPIEDKINKIRLAYIPFMLGIGIVCGFLIRKLK